MRESKKKTGLTFSINLKIKFVGSHGPYLLPKHSRIMAPAKPESK